MIRGVVKNNAPITRIGVGSDLNIQDVLVLIDTGFTGDLKISPKKAILLGLKSTHTEEIKLADQKTITMDAGFATVSLEGTQETVNVLISPGFSMIGVGLMKRFGYTLTIDFKYDLLTLQK